jgi:hypothetical protein
MSSLIFYTEQEQAIIATDTLAVSPGGSPFTFTTKAFHVPHLRMVIAGTGCGGFLDRWLCYLNSRMIVPGIDALPAHILHHFADRFLKREVRYGVPRPFCLQRPAPPNLELAAPTLAVLQRLAVCRINKISIHESLPESDGAFCLNVSLN